MNLEYLEYPASASPLHPCPQISKAHHWSLSLVLVDDNVETPEEEEAREEEEMEQEALGYKQAQERERR